MKYGDKSATASDSSRQPARVPGAALTTPTGPTIPGLTRFAAAPAEGYAIDAPKVPPPNQL